jgi:hypothetical protein
MRSTDVTTPTARGARGPELSLCAIVLTSLNYVEMDEKRVPEQAGHRPERFTVR